MYRGLHKCGPKGGVLALYRATIWLGIGSGFSPPTAKRRMRIAAERLGAALRPRHRGWHEAPGLSRTA